MKIKHAVLKNLNGNETLTTWLDVRPGLKAGAIVTLKDFKPNERWRVKQLFDQEHDASEFDFHRVWSGIITIMISIRGLGYESCAMLRRFQTLEF